MDNPFEVLGVPNGSDIATCKKQYRILSKKYHPDSITADAVMLQKVQDAYNSVKSGNFVIKKKRSVLSHETLFKYRVV